MVAHSWFSMQISPMSSFSLKTYEPDFPINTFFGGVSVVYAYHFSPSQKLRGFFWVQFVSIRFGGAIVTPTSSPPSAIQWPAVSRYVFSLLACGIASGPAVQIPFLLAIVTPDVSGSSQVFGPTCSAAVLATYLLHPTSPLIGPA